MKICLKVAFLCTAFSLCSHIGAADNSAELIKAGDKLVSGKKFGEGIVKYHSALKQGENPEVCYKLGIAYSRLKEDAAAAHYFREAIRLAKQSARKILYYQELAGLYQKVHDFPGMENVYKRALQDPEMANDKLQKRLIASRGSKYRNWIAIFISLKKYDSALRLLEMQKKQLGKKQYYQNLSRIRQAEAMNLIREKKYKDAAALLRNTIAMAPSTRPADNTLLYGTLISTLTKQKKFKEAQAELAKFSAADRKKYTVVTIFADYYGAQKQFNKAIECLNTITKDADARQKRARYFKICDLYLRSNDGKTALEYYKKAKAAVKDKWRVPAYEHRIKQLHPDAVFK